MVEAMGVELLLNSASSQKENKFWYKKLVNRKHAAISFKKIF